MLIRPFILNDSTIVHSSTRLSTGRNASVTQIFAILSILTIDSNSDIVPVDALYYSIKLQH